MEPVRIATVSGRMAQDGVVCTTKNALRGADFFAPKTRTQTAKVRGGVRRFVRTSLRNRIPVNREIFRVFRRLRSRNLL